MRRHQALIAAGGLLPLLLGAVAVVAITRAAGSFPVFDPRSRRAAPIVDLTWFVLVLVALVFLLTEGALLAFVFRYRHRGEPGEPRQIRGHRRLEVAWTVLPALLLAVVFALTVRAMRAVDAAGEPGLTIQVTGHQWWWEYRYPGQGVVTANELHIPAGQDVRLELTSVDVIHSFWVPQLGRKMDVVPGRTNVLFLRADEPGTFRGACAEYCGAQHAWMRLLVIAESPDQFAAWAAAQRQAPGPPATALAGQGRQLFLGGPADCAACHTIAGVSAGTVGPDLTHVGGRQTLAAGALTNSPTNLANWLANPQAVKPGNLMPDLRLSEDEIRALTAYLDSLK
jgi:cytochrome c oxidase subunit 2